MGLLGAFQDPQFRKDVARGLLDAGNRGAVAGLLGGPVDLATMALRPFGYNVEQPVGGSEWIGQKMQNLGLVSEKRNPLAEGLAAFAGPMAAQQIAPKVFAAELRAMENMAKPSPMNAATRGQAGAIVWHGSPHKFDKFDSSKIGTGEGAQAYGHGLYLAESPGVAQSYKEALANPSSPLNDAAKYWRQNGGEKAFKEFAKSADLDGRQIAEMTEAIKGGGALYKVDLPDDQIARMLDWDKPLSQQAPEVQTALAKQYPEYFTKGWVDIASGSPAPGVKASGLPDAELVKRGFAFGLPAEGNTAEMFYREISSRGVGDQAFQKGGHAIASKTLQDLGIPGIRYLDGGSRGAGTGSSNFVVFPGNEGLLRILERNGQALP